MVVIKQVPAAVVWPIRHQVMYPDRDFECIKLLHDGAGIHLALYEGPRVVSVISLFREADSLQFRKFATLPGWQRRGYGSQLLLQVIQLAEAEKVNRIWCNARTTATGFYERFGLQQTGECFSKGGFDYVIMERMLL